MVSINRMFSYLSPKILRPEKNCSANFDFFQVIKLYCICCCFIAISILGLPLVLMQQFCVKHCVMTTQSGFLSRFAHLHPFTKKKTHSLRSNDDTTLKDVTKRFNNVLQTIQTNSISETKNLIISGITFGYKPSSAEIEGRQPYWKRLENDIGKLK